MEEQFLHILVVEVILLAQELHQGLTLTQVVADIRLLVIKKHYEGVEEIKDAWEGGRVRVRQQGKQACKGL